MTSLFSLHSWHLLLENGLLNHVILMTQLRKKWIKIHFFFFQNVQKRQQAIKRKYASCKPFGYFVTLHFKKKHFSKKPTSAPVERWRLKTLTKLPQSRSQIKLTLIPRQPLQKPVPLIPSPKPQILSIPPHLNFNKLPVTSYFRMQLQ